MLNVVQEELQRFSLKQEHGVSSGIKEAAATSWTWWKYTEKHFKSKFRPRVSALRNGCGKVL